MYPLTRPRVSSMVFPPKWNTSALSLTLQKYANKNTVLLTANETFKQRRSLFVHFLENVSKIDMVGQHAAIHLHTHGEHPKCFMLT